VVDKTIYKRIYLLYFMANDFSDPVALDMGYSTLGRMHYILIMSNTAFAQQDLPTWWKCILVLYRELSPFLSKEEFEFHKAQKSECEKAIPLNGVVTSRKPWDRCSDWEIEIRRSMHKKGLLMKVGESAAGAMI